MISAQVRLRLSGLRGCSAVPQRRQEPRALVMGALMRRTRPQDSQPTMPGWKTSERSSGSGACVWPLRSIASHTASGSSAASAHSAVT